MAFLGIGKKKQKKAAQAAQQTINKIIDSGQQLSESNQKLAILASDGKITTKEKKILKQDVRQSNKTERTEIRQAASIQKVGARAHAREVAYSNGIDPRKWIADSVKSVANGVIGVASANALGKVGTAFAGRSPQTGANTTSVDMEEIRAMLAQTGGGVDLSDYTGEGAANQGAGVPPPVEEDKNKFIIILVLIAAALIFFGGSYKK